MLSPREVEELLENKALHALRSACDKMQVEDIAALISQVEERYVARFFRLLHKEIAAEVFSEMDTDGQEVLLAALSDAEMKHLLCEMFYDDTVDLIEEMPANVVQRIVANSTPEDRRVINELLRYPPDSAGGNMTTELVRLKTTYTVAQALEEIRRVGVNKETVYTCYVTDDSRRLLGVVEAKDLLLSAGDTPILDVMDENVISVRTLEDQESVARIMSYYSLIALPVVDTEGRLVGIVTIDDAVEILQDEVEEDFSIMAAINPAEAPYMHTSVLGLVKSRFPWLALLMLSATVTGLIISHFENALAQVVVLTAFIPMLMGTGGNSGSQSSVTVIRALSTGELMLSDWLRVVWKELRVAILCGVGLGVLAFGKVMLVDSWMLHNPEVTLRVAFVVSATLALTVLCAKLIGGLLPILARRLGLDPAVVASPFITTLVDAISLLLYFAIACSLIPAIGG